MTWPAPPDWLTTPRSPGAARGPEIVALFASLPQGEPLALIREPTNQIDAKAIQVWARDKMVGFVKSQQNKALAARMDRDEAFRAAAGWRASGRPESEAALLVAAELAALITEQFGRDREVAARAVMAVSQMLGTLLDRAEDGGAAEASAVVTAALALAAEQVVREAGTA